MASWNPERTASRRGGRSARRSLDVGVTSRSRDFRAAQAWHPLLIPVLLAGAGAVLGGSLIASARWKDRTTARLRQRARVAETALGSIEYGVSGTGPPIVMFHATPGGYDQGLVLGRFVAPTRCVVAASRPGYLGTPLDIGVSPEQQADAVSALLDALGIGTVAVLGASGGGPAALQFVLRHPERATALVLWQAVTHPTPLDADEIAGGFIGSDLGGWLALSTLALGPTLAFPAQIRRDRAAQRRLRALVGTLVPMDLRRAGVDNDVAQITELPDYPIERIEVPTLIVHGDADATVPYAHARAASHAIPNARLVTIAGGTHETLFADGRAVKAIAAFLAEHTARLPEVPVSEKPELPDDRSEPDRSPRRVSGRFSRRPKRRSSVLSWASLFSVASAASVLSVGSFASILSIGSFASVLSIGSSRAALSIGRSGGLLRYWRCSETLGRWRRSSPTPSVTTPTASDAARR